MPPSPAARRALIPYVILVVALILTAAATGSTFRAVRDRVHFRFDRGADRLASEIESRIDAYVAMLLGGAGLFAASEDVTFDEFHAYVERLELVRRYPGIQGIGFSRVVPRDRADSIAAELRRHVPSFHFWPETAEPTIHAIVYLEPQDERNRRAMGFNMFSEATRREAMMRACDTAAPAASGRVRLVQEKTNELGQAGFLIYVPIYRGGRIPASVGERRQELVGFVYSPFRADDLLRGIVAPLAHEAREATFSVYDTQPSEENLLHRSAGSDAPARFSTNRVIKVAGRHWFLTIRSGPGAIGYPARRNAAAVALAGTMLSFVLFAVTRAQIRARALAERTAADLRSSQEALTAANRSKDEFLAIVSHELRTPLNAIIGWAGMLRRGLVRGDEQHALDVIERNALAQARLVEDLLDISRAVAGKLRLELAEVDLYATLQWAIDAVRPTALDSGVDLALDASASLGTIRADPARLQQILINLLTNGIKFTNRGGSVRLTASRQSGQIVIRVIDTGKGIEPEFLPFVFDRFRQADTSSTRPHSGVGLGLAIVRHLVELHGGTIEVWSEGENRGTTFTIRLPDDFQLN